MKALFPYRCVPYMFPYRCVPYMFPYWCVPYMCCCAWCMSVCTLCVPVFPLFPDAPSSTHYCLSACALYVLLCLVYVRMHMVCAIIPSYILCHIIIHTMSHHHTYYVTSSCTWYVPLFPLLPDALSSTHVNLPH